MMGSRFLAEIKGFIAKGTIVRFLFIIVCIQWLWLFKVPGNIILGCQCVVHGLIGSTFSEGFLGKAILKCYMYMLLQNKTHLWFWYLMSR